MGVFFDSRLGMALTKAAAIACFFAAFGTFRETLAASGSWNVDANGNWNDAANWSPSVTGGAFGNGNTATFANDITADRTVTLDLTRALGSVVFGDADTSTSGSWVLNRAATEAFTLNTNVPGGTSFITVNDLGSGATATMSVVIGSSTTNSPSIVKNGVGTLVLAGTNVFQSNLAIEAGTLQVSTDRNLGAVPGAFEASRVAISNGATLATTAGFTMNANRGLTVGSGGGVLNITGGTLVFPSQATGAGQTLTVTGSSALSLTNTTGSASDVNWDFASNSGVRIFFNGSDALGTGDVSVGGGIRLVSQSTAPTSGQVTNAVTLANNAGLSARNSAAAVEYTNVTFPSSGTIVLNKDDQLTAALTISSNATLGGTLTVDTTQQAANAVGDVTLSGVFSGASGAITKEGTGTSGRLILGGANTYSGNTTINTGTLALGPSGSIANSAAIVVGSGTTFDVSAVAGGFALGAAQELSGSGSVVGNVTAAGTLAPGSGAIGTLSFGNNLSLGSGTTLTYQLDGGDVTVGSTVNDFIDLPAGDLVLDGTLNVTESVTNSFLSATAGNAWRLFNYSGTLTDNTLDLGTMPALASGLQFELDSGTLGQVNLVVTAVPVPEPSTLATGLMGVTLSCAATAFRRQRRKNGAASKA